MLKKSFFLILFLSIFLASCSLAKPGAKIDNTGADVITKTLPESEAEVGTEENIDDLDKELDSLNIAEEDFSDL